MSNENIAKEPLQNNGRILGNDENTLAINNLRVSVEGKEILKGINLTIRKGEIHALMGPNGSGKSTLSYTLMGHPGYKVEEGEILFKGENILELSPDQRGRRGIFLAFQYPVSIPGVSMANFLRMAVNVNRSGGDNGRPPIPMQKFRKLLKEKMAILKMEEAFTRRYINDGFSGGEKKKAEVLQMAMLEPEIAILDETDSGLDIDALRIVAEGVNNLIGPNIGVLIITHYQRILNYIKPQFVHVLYNGQIAVSGGPDLAQMLEEKGYDEIKERYSG